MGTPARPDVDSLENLSAAIVVDQERMGTNARSTVGTVTDAYDMLRVIFSRLGRAAHRPVQRVQLQRPGGHDQRRDHAGEGPLRDGVARDRDHRRHVPRVRGPGAGLVRERRRARRPRQEPQRGRHHLPGLPARDLVPPDLRRLGVLRSGQARSRLHRCRDGAPPPWRGDEGQDRQHQPHLHRAGRQDPPLLPRQGRRLAPARASGGGRANRDLHRLPVVRGHAAERAGALVAHRRQEHRRVLRHADQRPRDLDPRPRRARCRTDARSPRRGARHVRPDRPRLPEPRSRVVHALGRRVAADADGPPPRLEPDRSDLRLRRADDRPPCARRRADERPPPAAARQGQHGPRRRARPGGHAHRR